MKGFSCVLEALLGGQTVCDAGSSVSTWSPDDWFQALGDAVECVEWCGIVESTMTYIMKFGLVCTLISHRP